MKFFVALAGLAATVSGTTDTATISDHCISACTKSVRPTEPGAMQAFNKMVYRECSAAFQRSHRNGKLCSNVYRDASFVACELGCNLIQTGNPILNRPEVARFRQRCQELAGGAQGVFAQKACEEGYKAAFAKYDVEGVRLRVSIDEVCAGDVGGNAQEPEKPKEEPKKQPAPPQKKEEPKKAPVPPKKEENPPKKKENPPKKEENLPKKEEQPPKKEEQGVSIEEIQFADATSETNEDEPRKLRTVAV